MSRMAVDEINRRTSIDDVAKQKCAKLQLKEIISVHKYLMLNKKVRIDQRRISNVDNKITSFRNT